MASWAIFSGSAVKGTMFFREGENNSGWVWGVDGCLRAEGEDGLMRWGTGSVNGEFLM